MALREIKFRVWCAWEREMVNFSDLYMELEDGCLSVFKLIPNAFGLSDRVEMDTTDGGVKLMQFTGLRDKNGVEIYEGDVIKSSLGRVAAVEWEKEGRFLGFGADRSISYINREPAVEVIGNIYDNPELLKGAPTS